MAYIDNARKAPSPAAIAAVIGIHALVGYALVTGLSFTKIIESVPGIEGYEVEDIPLDPPPPPPPPEEVVEPQQEVSPPIYTPPAKLDIPRPRPEIETTGVLPPITELVIPRPVPSSIPTITPAVPSPKPKLADPVSAKPRNAPGEWVTTSDYMSRWIREEWTGTVGFRLGIGTDGRVESCSITRSSGHSELDEATCKLVTRRARFDAAKDGTGAKTSGSYSSAVRWQLPE